MKAFDLLMQTPESSRLSREQHMSFLYNIGDVVKVIRINKPDENGEYTVVINHPEQYGKAAVIPSKIVSQMRDEYLSLADVEIKEGDMLADTKEFQAWLDLNKQWLPREYPTIYDPTFLNVYNLYNMREYITVSSKAGGRFVHHVPEGVVKRMKLAYIEYAKVLQAKADIKAEKGRQEKFAARNALLQGAMAKLDEALVSAFNNGDSEDNDEQIAENTGKILGLQLAIDILKQVCEVE